MRAAAALLSTAILMLAIASADPVVDAAPASFPGLTNYDVADNPDNAFPPDLVGGGDDGDDDDDEEEDDYGSEDEEDEEEDYEDVGDYEIMMRQALTNYQTRSHRLLYSSLREGMIGDGMAEINPDGEVVADFTYGDNVEEELWQVQFGMAALESEWERLEMLKTPRVPQVMQRDDDDDDDDSEDEDVDEDGENDQEKRLFLENDPEFKALYDGITDHTVREDIYYDVKKEADMVDKMDPSHWYSFTYWQLHAYFGCARSFALSRPLYTPEMWSEVRQLWRDFAEVDKKSLPKKKNEPDRTYLFGQDSFDPPMEPFQSVGKGRSLKAKRDIAKGEMVFKATNNTVIFTRGHTWRLFLFHIYERHGEDGPFDSGTACDVLVWSWVQTLEEDGDLVIVADFDNGSLLNEGRFEKDWDPPNALIHADELSPVTIDNMNDSEEESIPLGGIGITHHSKV
ncbi:hypothetical protein ACHAW5_001943 [Stephanodiscus triporus]|uniref:Tyrosinase copper-binding domain-containing protein n=1 Tax=Stephanodiscus triporus TaxID=2934178 RepID=A0ABD3MMT2_9STRA